MKRILILMSMALSVATIQAQTLTLDECQQAARQNYPLIRQYQLVELSAGYELSNIQKGWLPQVSVSAQATLQSDVTAWPDEMQAMMQQMGINVKGLRRDQYRVGVDVSQTIYDGGSIGSQRDVARQRTQVEQARLDVSLYAVGRRVNDLYFGWLLVDDRLQLCRDVMTLLQDSERKLESMFRQGTASESDYQSVKAERLHAAQQLNSLEAQRRVLQRMLSVFCGREVTAVVKPAAIAKPTGNNRPELQLISAQLQLANAQQQALDAQLRPRLSLFASGFYGYPGYNMFEDMLHHRWTLNGIIGARLTWNLGALYTRKNDRARLDTQRTELSVQRDLFLFNNQLEQIEHDENIDRYRQLMSDDEEIIQLRTSVRRAAESKLAHGIIDVNALVQEISHENQARIQQSTHEIEMLKAMYDLKYATNE